MTSVETRCTTNAVSKASTPSDPRFASCDVQVRAGRWASEAEPSRVSREAADRVYETFQSHIQICPCSPILCLLGLLFPSLKSQQNLFSIHCVFSLVFLNPSAVNTFHRLSYCIPNLASLARTPVSVTSFSPSLDKRLGCSKNSNDRRRVLSLKRQDSPTYILLPTPPGTCHHAKAQHRLRAVHPRLPPP